MAAQSPLMAGPKAGQGWVHTLRRVSVWNTEEGGDQPCPSGLDALFGSYNQCCGIGPFLSIFNPQISACCSGVTLFGTLPRAHSFQLHSTTDPHIAFWEGPESPVWPLRCVPIKVHHLMPVVSQYGSWDTSRPLCLCSHCSLSVNTHPSYSYLLPLFFSHLLEDPAQSSPQGSLLVWHQMKAYLLSAPSALAFLVSALCFHFGGLPVCMMLYQQSPGVSCHSSRGEQE